MTKIELIKKLEESRNKVHQIIQNLDVNQVIYHDGGWRVRDIMLNISYWEYEAAKSLDAFAEGSEYVVPNLAERIDLINDETFRKYKDTDYVELLAYFDEGRVQLINALNRFTDEDLSHKMMAFYGGETTITDFIDFMVSHEQTHLEDIVNPTH